MRRIAMALVVSVLLLFASSARATELRPKAVVCPVCPHGFDVLVVRSTNTFGGMDFDFCAHAAGDQVVPLHVWTCPECRYSTWGSDFEKAVKDETKKRVLAGMPFADAVPKDASQMAIPAWAKYELARQVITWEGADAAALENVDWTGSWAVRLDGDDALDPVRKDESLAAMLKSAGDR